MGLISVVASRMFRNGIQKVTGSNPVSSISSISDYRLLTSVEIAFDIRSELPKGESSYFLDFSGVFASPTLLLVSSRCVGRRRTIFEQRMDDLKGLPTVC